MNNNDELIERDLNTLWHPCSQMKDYIAFPPLQIVGAKGAFLQLQNGQKILDAISSWWCKNLGHGHPTLIAALTAQAHQFEHVILANTTNDVIVRLSEKLTSLTSSLKKVLYASDGSCAVEMALKMAVHARYLLGQESKNKIVALQNSYHGETLFALSVSDVGIYRHAYEHYLPPCHFIQDLPYVANRDDPLWRDCESHWLKIEAELESMKDELSVVIIEPLLQGAGGMKLYSANFLARLRQWCTHHDVYLVADEILTGFGRTGKMLACQHADVEPDFLCLGKGLTGGVIPMSAVLTTNKMYDLFYDDYEAGKNFLHSHTHTGNALAAAVALASLQVLESEKILERTQQLEKHLTEGMQAVADKTQKLINLRAIGGVVAADLISSDQTRVGYEVYRQAVRQGVLLRPLGNTIYWLPPLNLEFAYINKLRDVTISAILAVLG